VTEYTLYEWCKRFRVCILVKGVHLYI